MKTVQATVVAKEKIRHKHLYLYLYVETSFTVESFLKKCWLHCLVVNKWIVEALNPLVEMVVFKGMIRLIGFLWNCDISVISVPKKC